VVAREREMNDTEKYIDMLVSGLVEQGLYFSIHRKMLFADGHTAIPGSAFTDIHLAARVATWWANKGHDIYLPMGGQKEVGKSDRPRKHPPAIRRRYNIDMCSSVYLDVDVKEGAYATQQDALIALRDFCKKYGLPKPSMIVSSGTGGIHVYWVADGLFLPIEHEKMSLSLINKGNEFGLKFDHECSIDLCRLLRVPGTYNFKTDPALPVELLYYGSKIPLSELRERFNGGNVIPIRVSPTPTEPSDNDDLLLPKREYPLADINEIAEYCEFLRNTRKTGGSKHENVIWHQTVLLSSYFMDGRELAHELSKGHPAYTFKETDLEYDRVETDRTNNPKLGPTKCATLRQEGVKECDTCIHFALGTSPVNVPQYIAKPQPTQSAPNVTPGVNTNTASQINLNELLPHRQWSLANILYREVSTLAGPAGSKKTSLSLMWACEWASGKSLIGDTVYLGSQKVLFISKEDSGIELKRRLQALAIYHNLTQADVDNIHLIGFNESNAQIIFTAGTDRSPLIDEAGFNALEKLIQTVEPRVVVLDPWAVFIPAGASNNSVITAAVFKLKLIADKYKIAILIVAHTHKNPDLEDTDSVSGAKSLINHARTSIMLKGMDDKEASRFPGITESWRYFRTIDARVSQAPPGANTRWLKLESVTLPNAEPPAYPIGDGVSVVTLASQHAMLSSPPPNTLYTNVALRVIDDAAKKRDWLTVTKRGADNTHNVHDHVIRELRKQGDTNLNLTNEIDTLIMILEVKGFIEQKETPIKGHKPKRLYVTDAGRETFLTPTQPHTTLIAAGEDEESEKNENYP
jgi:hypothetical protein